MVVLTTILDDAPEQKDLFTLDVVSGTHIDKYKLLSGKSTASVNIDQVILTQRTRGKERGILGKAERYRVG